MSRSKKITKAGGITIPRDQRQAVGLLPGVPVDVERAGDGIFIRKHVPTCWFCGSVDDVTHVCGIDVCRKCGRKISEVCR